MKDELAANWASTPPCPLLRSPQSAARCAAAAAREGVSSDGHEFLAARDPRLGPKQLLQTCYICLVAVELHSTTISSRRPDLDCTRQ